MKIRQNKRAFSISVEASLKWKESVKDAKRWRELQQLT